MTMSDKVPEKVPLEPASPEPAPSEPATQPPQIALVVSVLLFVGLYLWGFALSIVEMSQRDATA
jgi:hypothetical protein